MYCPDFPVKKWTENHLGGGSEEVNKFQVARVPINAKVLREDTTRDAVLSDKPWMWPHDPGNECTLIIVVRFLANLF